MGNESLKNKYNDKRQSLEINTYDDQNKYVYV